MLLVGFLACSMMNANDNPIKWVALSLKNAINRSFTDSFFYSFMQIFNRIDNEEKGKLEKYVKNNHNLSIDEQIDHTIEYIAPRMNDDEKLEFCRKINKLKDFEDPNSNPFSNFFYLNKKMTLESDNQGTYLIIEKKISQWKSAKPEEKAKNPRTAYSLDYVTEENTIPTTYKINLNKLSKLKEREFLQLFFALSEDKINKMENIIDCKKCYVDFITTKKQ